MFKTSFFKSKAPQERRVCIAKWNRFWKGPRASKFAPSNPKAVDWVGSYQNDLRERFPTPASLKEYLEEIETITPNPIFCCYENNPKECHRSVLAAFIEAQLKIKVSEWQPTSFQLYLF